MKGLKVLSSGFIFLASAKFQGISLIYTINTSFFEKLKKEFWKHSTRNMKDTRSDKTGFLFTVTPKP
jgi:hypothetical protein